MTDKKGGFDPVCFFAKRNDKISASVGQVGALSVPGSTVLDISTGPRLTYTRSVNPTWPFYIRTVPSPELLDAFKRVMKSCGLTYLTARIREFQAMKLVLVVQILAVKCLLGTSFVYHHVKTISPGLRKVVFYYSLYVAVTCQRSNSRPTTSFNLEFEDQPRKIWAARNLLTSPLSQARLRAKFSTEALCSVESTPRLATNHLTLMASGITETFPYKPFNVFLIIFSRCPAHLSKNTVDGDALQAAKRTLIVEAPRLHSIQSKERERLPN